MKQLFGGILLAVGILIAGASGLCSLAMFFSPGGEFGDRLSSLPLILIFGGPFIALGAGSAIVGRNLLREARGEREHEPDA